MKKRNTVCIAILISMIITLQGVYADSAKFTKDQQLHFTGDSSSPGTLYQDGVGGNLDVGIEICDVGSRHVGSCYALNNSGSWEYALVSYASSNDALADADNANGSCYYVTPGFVTVSPSYLTTPDPDVYKAALPGNLWIAWDTVANPGALTDFIYSNGDAQLEGSYSMRRTFNEATRQITVGSGQTPRATFITSSGSFTKDLDDASYGIDSERPTVVGVCYDSYGAACNDGELMTSESFPASYNTGLTVAQVNDTVTHTRYVVFNGMGSQICIGANLQVVVDSVIPDPIYYSQTLNITFTTENPRDYYDEQDGGNVEVTTNFDVNLTIYEQGNSSNVIYTNIFTMSNDLAPDATVQTDLNWQALAHSGFYVVSVQVDSDNDVVECNEADNSDTASFELKPITIPYIFIDGVNTSIFQYPNIPYNLTFHLENSDGDVLSNASVAVTEQNGLSLNSPTQVFNITTNGSGGTAKTGTVTTTRTGLTTDYYGNASITFIPTYNPLYLPKYNYTDLNEHVGNYTLFFNGTQEDGEDFIFINTTTSAVSGIYYFTVNNTNYTGNYSDKSIIYESIVSQVLDFVYQTFSNFLVIVLG